MLEGTLKGIRMDVEKDLPDNEVDGLLRKIRMDVIDSIMKDGLWADELEDNGSLDGLIELYQGSQEEIGEIDDNGDPNRHTYGATIIEDAPPGFATLSSPISPPTMPIDAIDSEKKHNTRRSSFKSPRLSKDRTQAGNNCPIFPPTREKQVWPQKRRFKSHDLPDNKGNKLADFSHDTVLQSSSNKSSLRSPSRNAILLERSVSPVFYRTNAHSTEPLLDPVEMPHIVRIQVDQQ